MSMSDRAVDVGVEPRQLKSIYKTIWYDKKKNYPLYCLYIHTVYYTYVREDRNRNIFGLFLHDTFLYNFKTSWSPPRRLHFCPLVLTGVTIYWQVVGVGVNRECTVNKHAWSTCLCIKVCIKLSVTSKFTQKYEISITCLAGILPNQLRVWIPVTKTVTCLDDLLPKQLRVWTTCYQVSYSFGFLLPI